MEFAFTDEQNMIADTARGLFAEQATSASVRAAMAGDGVDRALWQSFAQELGLAGVAVGEDQGGSGLGLVELAILGESSGYHVAALPMLGLVLVSQALATGGSDAQRASWLAPLLSGEAIGAWVYDPLLRVEGNTLRGGSRLVAHGAVADVFLVTDGTGAWLVDRGNASVRAQTTMDQTRPFAEVTLDGVAGDPLPDAGPALHRALQAGWVLLAAEGLGVAQAALDRTVAYSKERVQFGRPIGSFQAYKHRLADMMIEIEQARSAAYWAACAVDEGARDAALAVHAAKSFCTDTAFRCAGDMIQLHGGIGFTWEHDAHLYFKRARSLQTLLAPNSWHREQVAALTLGEVA